MTHLFFERAMRAYLAVSRGCFLRAFSVNFMYFATNRLRRILVECFLAYNERIDTVTAWEDIILGRKKIYVSKKWPRTFAVPTTLAVSSLTSGTNMLKTRLSYDTLTHSSLLNGDKSFPMSSSSHSVPYISDRRFF